MFFYYVTVLLLFLPSIIESSEPQLRGKIQNKNIFMVGVIGILIIEMGLRWETGSDWIPYLEHFYSQQLSTPFSNEEYSFELGYNFLVSAAKWLVPEYSFFLLLHAVIFFILLKKGYAYFTPYFIVALLLFYVSFLGVWGANRQFLAAGFGFVSLIYLYERKWWGFAIFLFLAFQFHSTSLLLLSFVFFKRRFSNKILLAVLIICTVIGFSSLPFKLFSLFGGVNELAAFKTSVYLEQAQETSAEISLFGLIKRFGIFIFFFIYRDRISAEYPKFNFIFNGYFLGICFYLIFFKSLLVMISRGSFYFNLLEPILLSYVFFLVKDKISSLLLSIAILIYVLITLNQAISAYPELFVPYKGLFINTDYKRDMF